jgi:hypothetical protein
MPAAQYQLKEEPAAVAVTLQDPPCTPEDGQLDRNI